MPAGAPPSLRTMSSASAGTLSQMGGNLAPRSAAGSNQQHVDYILVAEFSIDRGPMMEHQYPNPISGDEHMLAELMLPDGAHTRDQDWTIFFLHKDVESGGENEALDPSGQPPLIYVLNLVITKHDKEARRGANVKAMAICTRHSFLHIYKPILLLALEEYFKHPTIDTLSGLFTAVNDMDLSAMPKLSVFERLILNATENKEMFAEKFEETSAAVSSPTSRRRSPSSIFGEQETTGRDRKESNATYIDLAPGRNVLMNGKISTKRDCHEYETRVVYNQIPVPIKVPVAVIPETVGDFSLIQLIQTFSPPPGAAPQQYSLHPHLTTNGPFTHPIIVLVNGLLTEKRIVFLSHDRPSGEVANHVLAACALASGGILRGFTRYAFPYTDVSKVEELLMVPGFIAGVKNPVFAHHPDWWDILCEIDTGRIRISPNLQKPPQSEASKIFHALPNVPSNGETRDNAFMEDITKCINARFGEKAVRLKFSDYIMRFTMMTAAFEELVYGSSPMWIGHEENHVIRGHGCVWPDDATKMKELAGNVGRIEGWINTRTYHSYVHDAQTFYMIKPVKIMDLRHQVERLRNLSLSNDESAKIYQCFKEYVNDYEEINQLLSYLPDHHKGIYPIATGLFHQNQKTRFAVVELLERIQNHPAGVHFFNSMNRFFQLAFVRLQQEKANAGESPVAINGLNVGFNA